MRAEIISVGTELLLGDIVNTNAQYLARELASLGFTVYYQSVVGDNPMRLKSLVHQAKERSEVLIFTGGLGPTDDDLTKETVAEAFGDTLVMDPEELVKLEMFFEKLNRTMAPNNRKQAMVPRRGQKLNNPNGTAPGVMFRQGGKYAFLLPGPPREMTPMFENEVQPILEALQDGAIRSRTLHIVGVGESDLEMKLKDFVGGQNPSVALYAKEGEVHVRVTAKGQTPQQADYMCTEMANLVREVLGDIVYSSDDSSLPQTVVTLLQSQGESVALAESCTGGLLAERLTSVSGASDVFGYGAVSYANEFKHKMLGVRNHTLARHGAVSSQVCAEMAFGAAKKGIADYGVGITGIAGPGGGSEEKPVGLVYVGVSKGKDVWIRKLFLPSRKRDSVRHMATQNALDMVRRLSLGLDVPGAKCFAENQHADFERVGRAQWRGVAALRVVGAVLFAALFLLVLLLLGYYNGQSGQQASAAVMPSEQGLYYGTEEYTQAVQQLLHDEKAVNPAVERFVALPGGLVESFVVESQKEQSELVLGTNQAALNETALLAKNANLQGEGSNALLLGGSTLRPMLELANVENIDNISSFTCYTEDETLEYLVFAVAYLEDIAFQADGFDAATSELHSYSDYLQFVLGAKGRSLYTIDVDVQESDSFMTLQTQDPDVPGQSLLLFGRLLRAGESADDVVAQPAGQPLMPNNFYEAEGYSPPDIQESYEQWLLTYLTQGVSNMQLQMNQGMPAEDIAPTVVLYPEVETAPAEENSTEDEAETNTESVQQSAESVVRSLFFNETPVSVEKALLEENTPVFPDKTATTSVSNAQPPVATSNAQATSSPTSVSTVQSEVAIQAPSETTPQPVVQRPDARFLVVRMNGVLVRDTTTAVLAAICQHEMAGAPEEAIKAQAVALHSWILNQQGSGNPAPSVRGALPSQEMRTTVEAVSSLVVSADGYNPAFTPWFAHAAGGTNSSADMFSVQRSYLQQIPTEGERGASEIRQTVEISQEDMHALLVGASQINEEDLGEPSTWFAELVHNESGYVTSLTLAGATISGLELWQNILVENGKPLLQSPAFTVEFNGSFFRISVFGEGHGCGLSQAGAVYFAENSNFTYEQILAHYFPETELIDWV